MDYGLVREAVGWGLIAITPINLLLLYLINYLNGTTTGFYTEQVIYYFAASSSLSVIGIAFVVEEYGKRIQERERRQMKRRIGILCSVCGAVMGQGETKCRICGSSPLKECASCGSLMSITAEQCPRCGYGSA